LSSLKVATIVIFILLGLLVNVGANREYRFIGFENWTIPGAPFVGGFGGFAHVFVTASFACRSFLHHSQTHLISCYRRWDGEPRDHCRRNKEPQPEHATGR
jgi:Amino acid permease